MRGKEPRSRADIAAWSMKQRLDHAASDYSSALSLLWLTEWIIADLNRSKDGFEAFAAWRPGPAEERDADILSALVHNKNLPNQAANLIVASGWWRIKPQVLERQGLDFEAILSTLSDLVSPTPSGGLWLGASFSLAVKSWFNAVVNHSEFHQGILEPVIEISWHEPQLLALIAARGDLDGAQYHLLASHPNPAVRGAIMSNHEAPDEARVFAALSA